MNFTPKQVITFGLGITTFLLLVIMFFTSWEDVTPGNEGFMYRPYTSGIDSAVAYSEGTFFIPPWNTMITYNVLNQKQEYTSELMDKNGTTLTIITNVSFGATRGKLSKLHLKHGVGYIQSFVDPKVFSAIKDVVGRYTYEEVFSTKRESLENEIEAILTKDFNLNYVTLGFVEIADVNLPDPVNAEITAKEAQKQRNQKSELMKIEEKNLADARIEKARGDSSLVVSAEYKALAIKKEAQELAKNPQYIEFIKWKGYADGNGSPFGTQNVFVGVGEKSTGILKSVQ